MERGASRVGFGGLASGKVELVMELCIIEPRLSACCVNPLRSKETRLALLCDHLRGGYVGILFAPDYRFVIKPSGLPGIPYYTADDEGLRPGQMTGSVESTWVRL